MYFRKEIKGPKQIFEKSYTKIVAFRIASIISPDFYGVAGIEIDLANIIDTSMQMWLETSPQTHQDA
ncbi:hypothetical protein TWF506_010011 [Arthrobotrys conoides]|uniref:Uncharacterized protein n=1 Tax=Arthrobotrys conoides TaxID=74498 RepID=A0AAN8PDD9_9PEZI